MARVTAGPKQGGDWEISGSESQAVRTQQAGIAGRKQALGKLGSGEWVVKGGIVWVRMQNS